MPFKIDFYVLVPKLAYTVYGIRMVTESEVVFGTGDTRIRIRIRDEVLAIRHRTRGNGTRTN